MPEPTTPAEYAAALQKEYGTYVAVTPIDIDGVRAFNEGHAVPVSHVENGTVPADSVAKVGSKAAAAVPATASPAPKKD